MKYVQEEQIKLVEDLRKQIINDTNKNKENKDKKGIRINKIYGKNKINNKKVPIYIADYVLSDYGTGAIMGVPGHDSRDKEFAIEHKIEMESVITEDGIMKNSGPYNGLKLEDAKNRIIENLIEKDIGGKITTYKIHDWLVSRQRYWGAPIPLIHCQKCGVVPVPEKELPIKLPSTIKLTGRGTALAKEKEWLHTKCPNCNSDATRDSDTMDTFVDSSWYFFRYPDANNKHKIFETEKVNKMLPVTVYIGGIEHAILHLLYSRFVTKFLYDQ